MPDHVHLLLSEPPATPLHTSVQVIKQRFSLTCAHRDIWEPRYHDFNVFTEPKRAEKLHYIHQNPVRRGLVTHPSQWPWSSYNHLDPTTPGPVHLSHPRF